VLNPEDPVVRTAVFGRQVEDFVNSEIGRHITARADDEISECLQKLKVTRPNSLDGIKHIESLQSRVAVCERVIAWLAEAITEGHQAMNIIEDKND
jgi:hypothetical protein